jgi:hypothetical protein
MLRFAANRCCRLGRSRGRVRNTPHLLAAVALAAILGALKTTFVAAREDGPPRTTGIFADITEGVATLIAAHPRGIGRTANAAVAQLVLWATRVATTMAGRIAATGVAAAGLVLGAAARTTASVLIAVATRLLAAADLAGGTGGTTRIATGPLAGGTACVAPALPIGGATCIAATMGASGTTVPAATDRIGRTAGVAAALGGGRRTAGVTAAGAGTGVATTKTATRIVLVALVLVAAPLVALLAIALLGAPTQPLVGMFGLGRILAAGDECAPQREGGHQPGEQPTPGAGGRDRTSQDIEGCGVHGTSLSERVTPTLYASPPSLYPDITLTTP